AVGSQHLRERPEQWRSALVRDLRGCNLAADHGEANTDGPESHHAYPTLAEQATLRRRLVARHHVDTVVLATVPDLHEVGRIPMPTGGVDAPGAIRAGSADHGSSPPTAPVAGRLGCGACRARADASGIRPSSVPR